MAPEAHWAQVLPDPDLGSYKVTYPTKLGVPSNFCFIKYPPKCTAEAPEPLLGPLDLRVTVGGIQPHQIAIRDKYNIFDFISYPS